MRLRSAPLPPEKCQLLIIMKTAEILTEANRQKLMYSMRQGEAHAYGMY